MKQASIILVATSFLIGLNGCNDEKKAEADIQAEVVQTVDWYKEHKNERRAVLEKCKSNPGELAATPNCINAAHAESSSTWASRSGGTKIVPLSAADLRK